MHKSTEEFLKEITKELNFLNIASENIANRIEQIEETIQKVYDRIDNCHLM